MTLERQKSPPGLRWSFDVPLPLQVGVGARRAPPHPTGTLAPPATENWPVHQLVYSLALNKNTLSPREGRGSKDTIP